jgi:sugar O-acyltransferase (sialic acid O-acetyltransferase NeuD family)
LKNEETVKNLVIIGAGGYAQEVLWVVDEINDVRATWKFLGFIDPRQPHRKGQSLYDRPILGGWDDLPASEELYFSCGIGDPAQRQFETENASSKRLFAATVVHPSVMTAKHTSIGEGTIIGPRCVLAPYSTIGKHCALNIGVTVGHNSSIGDYCVLSPGAQVLGNVQLSERVFIGANATVYLGRKVGPGSTVGANSFLLTNLGKEASVVGVPAAKFSAATGAGICTNQEIKPLREKSE